MLGMAVGICVLGGIRSQAADTWKAREAYYEQLEREYVGRVRQFLEERGYRSSGVTLSRIVDHDGRRSYRVLVHHGILDRQGEEIQAEVLGGDRGHGLFCARLQLFGADAAVTPVCPRIGKGSTQRDAEDIPI